MYHLRITPQAKTEVRLVLYGYARSWRERPRRFDALVNQALLDIKLNPTAADEHRVPGVAGMVVYSFHIGRTGKPAIHKFVYRIVDNTVEIGRFLHQAEDPIGNLPPEWITKATAA